MPTQMSAFQSPGKADNIADLGSGGAFHAPECAMRAHAGHRDAPSISDSFQEYGRGLAGGLMFSLPLLYTMEMWWAGFIASPLRLAGLLAFTFILLLGYNRFAGMHEDATWIEVIVDSVEELGLGVLTSAAILYLIGRIGPDSTAAEAFGKVVVEAAVVAIGFSVGTAQLNANDDDREARKRKESGDGADARSVRGAAALGAPVTIAFCGAVLFASNIGPTEEILLIAIETGPLRLAALALASLLIGSVVLHFSAFRRSETVVHRGTVAGVVFGTVLTYAVALAASAIILWFFGRFEGSGVEIAVRQIVVLAFPATIGASAGRLLLSR